ncbi:MAG TPA: recombination regulator RecX [Burkholderiales bacterium]
MNAAQLRMRGIALLARREHSRAELQNKLKRYSEDAALITQVLDQLQAEKLLSDARFAESVARVRGARFGSARVAQDLRAKGVSGEVAGRLVSELKATDAERAQAAWEKRFGDAPADAAERAKQMRFLQSRGFSPEVIRRVVPRAQRAAPEDSDD